MKNKNVVVKKACHSRGMLSGIYNACCCKIEENSLLNTYVEDPRLQTSGMTPLWVSGQGLTYREEALNKNSFRAPLRSGFTLIELLVVVLIIGILAAVAVPQYQKAVEKSRWAGAFTMMHAIENAEDLWKLEYGIPTTEDAWFTGRIANHSLGIDIPTQSVGYSYATTKYFTYSASCGKNYCQFTVQRTDDGDAQKVKLYLFFWHYHTGLRTGGCSPGESYPIGTEICARFNKEFIKR